MKKGRKGKKSSKEKKKEKYYRNLDVIKCESIWISNQKHREMFQRVSSRVPIPIEPPTLM